MRVRKRGGASDRDDHDSEQSGSKFASQREQQTSGQPDPQRPGPTTARSASLRKSQTIVLLGHNIGPALLLRTGRKRIVDAEILRPHPSPEVMGVIESLATQPAADVIDALPVGSGILAQVAGIVLCGGFSTTETAAGKQVPEDEQDVKIDRRHALEPRPVRAGAPVHDSAPKPLAVKAKMNKQTIERKKAAKLKAQAGKGVARAKKEVEKQRRRAEKLHKAKLISEGADEDELKEADLVAKHRPMVKANKYNGLTTGRYAWRQDVRELTLCVFLREDTQKEELDVTLDLDLIKVGYKGTDPIIMGPPKMRFDIDNSAWHIGDWDGDGKLKSPRKVLEITLIKRDQGYWSAPVEGENEVDTEDCQLTESLIQDMDDQSRDTMKRGYDTICHKPVSNEHPYANIEEDSKEWAEEMRQLVKEQADNEAAQQGR